MSKIYVKQSGYWRPVGGSPVVQDTFHFPNLYLTDTDDLYVSRPDAIAIYQVSGDIHALVPAAKVDDMNTIPATVGNAQSAIALDIDRFHLGPQNQYSLESTVGNTNMIHFANWFGLHSSSVVHDLYALSNNEAFALTNRPSGVTAGTQNDKYIYATNSGSPWNVRISDQNTLNNNAQYITQRNTGFIYLNQRGSRTLYAYNDSNGNYSSGNNITVDDNVLAANGMRGLCWLNSDSSFYIADYDSSDSVYRNKIYVANASGTFDLDKTIYLDSTVVGVGDTIKGLDGTSQSGTTHLFLLIDARKSYNVIRLQL